MCVKSVAIGTILNASFLLAVNEGTGASVPMIKRFIQQPPRTLVMELEHKSEPSERKLRQIKKEARVLEERHGTEFKVSFGETKYYKLLYENGDFIVQKASLPGLFASTKLEPHRTTYGMSSNVLWRLQERSGLLVMNHDKGAGFGDLTQYGEQTPKTHSLFFAVKWAMRFGFPPYHEISTWDGNTFLSKGHGSSRAEVEGRILVGDNNVARGVEYSRRLGEGKRLNTTVAYEFGSKGRLFPVTMEIKREFTGRKETENRKGMAHRLSVTSGQVGGELTRRRVSPAPFIEKNRDDITIRVVSNSTSRLVYANGEWGVPEARGRRGGESYAIMARIAIVLMLVIPLTIGVCRYWRRVF